MEPQSLAYEGTVASSNHSDDTGSILSDNSQPKKKGFFARKPADTTPKPPKVRATPIKFTEK